MNKLRIAGILGIVCGLNLMILTILRTTTFGSGGSSGIGSFGGSSLLGLLLGGILFAIGIYVVVTGGRKALK